MFDPKRTFELISGGLMSPAATWERYLGQNPGWQVTAIQLTVPLVVLAVLVGWILSAIFGTHFYWGYGHGLVLSLIIAPIAALLALGLMSLVVSFLAGQFGGQFDFNRGFAGVSLAAIPSYVGSALGPIPWIGWLLSLIGAITSLVFLYKIIPLALGVPENRRVLHFIVALVLVFIVNVVLSLILGFGAATRTSSVTMGG